MRRSPISSLPLLPFLLAAGCSVDWSVGDGVSSYTSGDHSVLKIRGDGVSLRLESDGEVTFSDDEREILALEPGGSFELIEQRDGVERELTVRRAGGGLEFQYRVDGADQTWDASGREWLATALQRAFRESGFDAENRLDRLIQRGGAALVLEEIALLQSEWVRANYLKHLFARETLDATQAERALALAGELGSDYELRHVLAAALDAPTTGVSRPTPILRVARELESDYELGQLLRQAAPLVTADAADTDAWLTAAGQLDSDYELARALEHLLEESGTSDALVAKACAQAAKQLDSDYELGQVLNAAVERTRQHEVAVAYLEACAAFDSDYELGGALRAVAEHAYGDTDLNRRYRELARRLGDYERGRALAALDDAESR